MRQRWRSAGPAAESAQTAELTLVPTIIIAPLAKPHFVDHTQYETDSILAFIEKRWTVQPLGQRDANANPLSNAFTLTV